MALVPSRRCRRWTYGICERCDECGYMTRREMYENLKNSSKKLYEDSKKNVEEMEKMISNISELEMNCNEILQMLKEKSVRDKKFRVRNVLARANFLSKVAKKQRIALKNFMDEMQKINEIAQKVENNVDF